MSALVSKPAQAVANIKKFATETAESPELQGRLAYARSWYAVQDDHGEWLFGPSKFCGYVDMTAKEYLNDDPRDGRRTERQLSQWFTEISESDAAYGELNERLVAFLDLYGKVPSTAIRINVLHEAYADQEAEIGPKDKIIADLIILISKQLPHSLRSKIRTEI